MQKIQFITLDGPDCVGKTTQLGLLTKLILERYPNRPIHQTKLLGGDGKNDALNKLRAELLDPNFDHSDPVKEQTLFSFADSLGLDGARRFLEENPDGIVIKDRGNGSNLIFAMTLGLNMKQVEDIHYSVILKERYIDQQFGTLNLILVPNKSDFIEKRLAARGPGKLDWFENQQRQLGVLQGFRQIKDFVSMQGIRIELVDFEERDTIVDIHDKIKKVLDKYHI